MPLDPSRLDHVYWIGGSPCSGKSTIADRIACEFGMVVYRCDDAYDEHLQKIGAEGQPVFHRIAGAHADEIWLRPVERQIGEALQLYREEFPFILDDLLDSPADRPIVAEGAALLPELVSPLHLDPRRACWIVPSEAFQRRHYEQRAWRHDVLHECSDPARGWDNWMRRDAGFAREVSCQATAGGNHLVVVDGTRSLDEVFKDVRTWFALPECGP